MTSGMVEYAWKHSREHSNVRNEHVMLQYWWGDRHVCIRQQYMEDSHGRQDWEGKLGLIMESPGHQVKEFLWMRHAAKSRWRILSRYGISKTCVKRMHVVCTVGWERLDRGKEPFRSLLNFPLNSYWTSALGWNLGKRGRMWVAFPGNKWHYLLVWNGKERGNITKGNKIFILERAYENVPANVLTYTVGKLKPRRGIPLSKSYTAHSVLAGEDLEDSVSESYLLSFLTPCHKQWKWGSRGLWDLFYTDYVWKN